MDKTTPVHLRARTIENWDAGVRQCPEYLKELMRYKLEHEGIITYVEKLRKP